MDRNAIYAAWRALSGASRVALGLAGVAIIVLLWISPAVVSAIFVNSLDSVTQEAGYGETEALAYSESVRQNMEFVCLRSPFFAPAPPPPKVVKSDPQPINTGPKPAPRTYGGPKLIGLVGREGALFDKPVVGDKQYIAVGQKGGQVEIVSIEQPWKAKVRWAGGEFELNLFDRLEALPTPGLGGATPLGQPVANIFGGGTTTQGTAATASGELDFGAAAGDSTEPKNN